jgi:predicted membrane chloride channel (bestrophin family)
MKTKTVSYSKVFSLGNYENEKIGVEIEVEPGDDVQKAIQEARQFVEFNHKLNGLATELEQCERIVNDPDSFTGTQVRRAKERISQIHEQIRTGAKLLNHAN